jgi:Kef-type K+ transport system membrane component KefB/CBS domain-containing protein
MLNNGFSPGVPMDASYAYTFAAAAAALFLALFVGRLVFRLHLPRVTGYLLTGLVAGPSMAHWTGLPPLLNTIDVERLSAVAEVALALILVSIGMQFRSEHLRRWRSRLLIFSGSEVSATFVLVMLAGTIINQFWLQQFVVDDLWLSSLYIGLFMGTIAIATAPAATLLVVREIEAAGPVTDAVVTLIGLNNLTAILVFNLAFHFLLHPEAGASALATRLLLPIAIGAAVGLLMSVWSQRLEAVSERQVLVLGGAIGVAGLCRFLGIDMLLGCFTCGAVLANSAPRAEELLAALKQKDYVFYVLFFVQAGAGLHLDLLADIGVLGAGYVATRAVGKLFGAYWGARWGGFSQQHVRWTGTTLLAQAGVAIGMATTLKVSWEAGGQLLETVVLGAVVVFELTGPVAARLGLIRAGEVPVLSLLAKRAPTSTMEGLHHVVEHFRTAMGLPAGHKVDGPGDILVSHIMRKNVDTVLDATPFNELLRHIAHSRYDRFPVVDAEGNFKGIVDYADVRDILFDPILGKLIIASELTKPVFQRARADQTLAQVLDIFRQHKDISYLPVVDADDQKKLLGILNHNDVLAAFQRFS